MACSFGGSQSLAGPPKPEAKQTLTCMQKVGKHGEVDTVMIMSDYE